MIQEPSTAPTQNLGGFPKWSNKVMWRYIKEAYFNLINVCTKHVQDHSSMKKRRQGEVKMIINKVKEELDMTEKTWKWKQSLLVFTAEDTKFLQRRFFAHPQARQGSLGNYHSTCRNLSVFLQAKSLVYKIQWSRELKSKKNFANINPQRKK